MSENKSDKGYASLTGFKRAVPIILLALAAFVALCFITKETGALGNIISGVLLGLFARGAYAIPVLLAVHAVFYASDVAERRTISRVIFSFVALVSLSAVIYTVGSFGTEPVFDAEAFYNDGTAGIGGGFIGSLVAFAIVKIFGHVGLIIIAVAIIALYISFFFAKSRGAAKRSFYGALLAFAKLGAKIESKISAFFGKIKSHKSKRAERISQQKADELFDDEYFAVDNGMKELSIPALGIHETRSDKSLEENPTLQSKVRHKSAEENFVKTDFTPKKSFAQTFADERDFSSSKAPEKEERRMLLFPEITHSSEPAPKKPSTSERASYGLDCSADEIFTKDFSPIDFALDSSEANRPSSKAASAPIAKAAPEIKESIHSISERDIEMARRKADFDMKKKAALEAMRAQQNAAMPETDTSYAADRYNRAAQFISGVNEEYSKSVQLPEYHREPAPAPSFEEPRERHEGVYAPEGSYGVNIPSAPSESLSQPTEPEAYSEPSNTAPYTPAPQLHTEKTENVQSFSAPSVSEAVFNAPTAAEPIFSEPAQAIFEAAAKPVSDGEVIAAEAFTDSREAEEAVPQENIFEQKSDGDGEVITLSRVMLTPSAEADNAIYVDIDEAEADGDRIDGPLSEYATNENVTIEIPEDEQVEEESLEFTPQPTPSATANLYTYSDDLGKDEKIVVHEETVPAVEEEPKKKRPDYSTYKFPSLEILGKSDTTYNESLTEEMEENGNKIIETLASFNVLASIKGYDRGPRITRYEVVPAKGVRVNQVVNLFDDIALSLAAEGIRIEAPIPGKSAIGFELPNKTPETVRLRDLLETDEFKNAPSKTLACIGKDVTGSPVFGDIAKMPHVLIAGATGMGKSVCINSILISILYKARPDEVKLILIDPKKVEFKMYNGIPHLLVPVVSDAKQAAGALMWAVEEMERRYDAIEEQNVRNIEGYNEKVRANPKLGEPMPKLIIVIDELNDLMLQVRDPVEGLIMSIAQKARAAGIHLIIGTQRPSVNVITGVIKANIPSRMSCKVASYTDSKTILERAGAERLLDKGDMLYHPVGTPKPVRVQSAFVSDPEVYAVMDALKENRDLVSYDDKVMEDITRAAQKCVKSKGGSSDDRDIDGDGAQDAANYMHDKQFLDAVDIAVTSGKISTSLIQRRIGVGYGKAAKFIDIMEGMGIVSEPNGQKPRETLISKDDWIERLANY